MVDLLGTTLAVLAALGLAGQAIFVRLGTDKGRANDAVVIVLAVNMLLIAPIATVVSYPDYRLTPVAVLAFVAAGALATMLGRILLYAGIQRIGASRAEPIKASTPLHATVIAVLVLGEAVTPRLFVGVVLVVIGVGLVSWEGSRTSAVSDEGFPLVGLALPFLAALFFGIEPIFAKIGFEEGTPFLVGLAIKTTAAVATFAGYLAWRGELPTRDLVGRDLRWHVAAGVASSVSMVTYWAALVRAPVAIVVPIVQSSPLFVALLSVAFLQRLERVTPRLVAAATVVVAGAVLVTLAG